MLQLLRLLQLLREHQGDSTECVIPSCAVPSPLRFQAQMLHNARGAECLAWIWVTGSQQGLGHIPHFCAIIPTRSSGVVHVALGDFET